MENKENQPIRNNSPLSNGNLKQPSANSIRNEINQQNRLAQQPTRPPQPQQPNRPLQRPQPNQQFTRPIQSQQRPQQTQQTTPRFAQHQQSNQQTTRPAQPQQQNHQPIRPTQPIANQTKPQQVNPAINNQVQNLRQNLGQENAKINQNDKAQTQTKTNENDLLTQSNRFNNLGEPVRSSLRSKINNDSIDLVELEQLNETNLKNFKARTRRNRVVIIVLTLLLIITAGTIGILLAISKLTNNAFLYIHGGVSATHVVDGYELNRFRTPSEIQGNRLLSIDLDLKIESSGSYNIRFTIDIFQNGEELDNTIIYEYNNDLFYSGNDGYYYSKNPIAGDQTIDLCQGVLIDYRYEHTLNIDNFRMEVHTYIDVAT